jgi:hypothetical protein
MCMARPLARSGAFDDHGMIRRSRLPSLQSLDVDGSLAKASARRPSDLCQLPSTIRLHRRSSCWSVPRLLNPMHQFRVDFELRVRRVKDRRFCDSLRNQQSIKRVAVMRGQCGNMGGGGRPYW